MGFTPLEGLVMATRSGSVDPGLLLWLLEHGDLSAADLGTALEKASGLLGLAGDADMRTVLAAADAGEPAAGLAIGVYVHHLRAGIAAMAAAMGGIDAIVFTGGVGEHAAAIRELALRDLAFLGVAIDPASNASDGGDREIGSAEAPVRIFVVAAREDLQIAREVRAVLAARGAPTSPS
jgi:acetate kinase